MRKHPFCILGQEAQPWVRELDFSTLEPVSSSYVSDDLRGREDDAVWRVKYKQNWI